MRREQSGAHEPAPAELQRPRRCLKWDEGGAGAMPSPVFMPRRRDAATLVCRRQHAPGRLAGFAWLGRRLVRPGSGASHAQIQRFSPQFGEGGLELI